MRSMALTISLWFPSGKKKKERREVFKKGLERWPAMVTHIYTDRFRCLLWCLFEFLYEHVCFAVGLWSGWGGVKYENYSGFSITKNVTKELFSVVVRLTVVLSYRLPTTDDA